MNFSIDNWLTLISLGFAVIGGIFALCQWKSSVKIKRVDFINQINERIRFDKKFAETLYTIEYGEDWYDFHSKSNSEEEKNRKKEKEFKFDKVLSYLDYICYLKKTKNISKREFEIFKYRINRVCISRSTKKYLWNLMQFSKKNNADCTFQYLIDYGIDNKLFPKDFKDNISLYDKTLNW
jgi:hypothetical protein